MKLTADELYTLKRAMLEADRAKLRAQLLATKIQDITLELSKKYGSLDKPLSINFDTGEIIEDMEG